MRKLCTAGLVALSLILSLAYAQRTRGDEEETSANFRCQAGQRLSTSADSARVFVAYSFPYDNLVFVRNDADGFSASLESSISLFDDEKMLQGERTTITTVSTSDFKQTNSRTTNAVHSEEFFVAPGKYEVFVVLLDRESKRKFRWTGELNAVHMDTLLAVSDIYWAAKDSAQEQQEIPRVVGSFSNREEPATARIELFSAGLLPLEITWKLVGEDGATVLTDRSECQPVRSVQILEHVVEMSELVVQKYSLHFEAIGNGRREEREISFSVSIPGLPAQITDLGLAIRQVKYIASAEENRRLRGASLFDREQLFREFWKRRDPTPDTPRNELMEEYYFRVQYADDHYATHRPGWETDRGRIYILFGEPTDIERHPFESGSRPYEIWYYHNLNRRFVFVDYTGFGDYTLEGPQLGY